MSPDASTPAELDTLVARLSDGLHELANVAGLLEEQLADRRLLDDDRRLALDQAHSNASALLATLDRLGLG